MRLLVGIRKMGEGQSGTRDILPLILSVTKYHLNLLKTFVLLVVIN